MLDEVLVGVWERPAAHRVVRCVVCGEDMSPEYGAHARPIGGGRHRCGTALRWGDGPKKPARARDSALCSPMQAEQPRRYKPSRKVRTSQGKVVGNADPGKPAGKCHRNNTA